MQALENVQVSKEDAIRLLREHSWAPTVATCGHTGCEDHEGPSEQRMIHTFSCKVPEVANALADLLGWLHAVAEDIQRTDRTLPLSPRKLGAAIETELAQLEAVITGEVERG